MRTAGWPAMIRDVVAYDMTDEASLDVATLLLRFGSRIQLSVFECDLRTQGEAATVRSKLHELVDPVDDQVRLYPPMIAPRGRWS